MYVYVPNRKVWREVFGKHWQIKFQHSGIGELILLGVPDMSGKAGDLWGQRNDECKWECVRKGCVMWGLRLKKWLASGSQSLWPGVPLKYVKDTVISERTENLIQSLLSFYWARLKPFPDIDYFALCQSVACVRMKSFIQATQSTSQKEPQSSHNMWHLVHEREQRYSWVGKNDIKDGNCCFNDHHESLSLLTSESPNQFLSI